MHPISSCVNARVSALVLLSAIACAHGRPTDEFGPTRRLPLGNGHVSSAPRVGYVFSCRTTFNGRAGHGGPWISGNSWDPGAKPVVSGNVRWPNARISMSVGGDQRIIRANNLPVTHPTGVFPIRPTDSAYQYDRNPNEIREQTVLLTLPANPTAAVAPSCLPMGMIGFALSGVAIYNALDAAGMDAVANEIQDRCKGHPQMIGQYHYHNMSVCLTDPDGSRGNHSDLIGFALDGYGIYGPHGERGKLLSNADLDACHGHEHVIDWNGVKKKLYHYHATAEYPYTLGCYHGTLASERQKARTTGGGAEPRR